MARKLFNTLLDYPRLALSIRSIRSDASLKYIVFIPANFLKLHLEGGELPIITATVASDG